MKVFLCVKGSEKLQIKHAREGRKYRSFQRRRENLEKLKTLGQTQVQEENGLSHKPRNFVTVCLLWNNLVHLRSKNLGKVNSTSLFHRERL